MNPKVDAFLREAPKWREEMAMLRTICLECGLAEEVKWGKPCYTFQEANVVIIQPFKDYCALLFTKGALLKDPRHILNRIGEHTQAARQVRFTELREIIKQKSVLKAYINEAIGAEKAGLEVVYRKDLVPMPAELQEKLEAHPALKKAFGALTPGRQRAYIYFFSGAKQPKTRVARIEKCMKQILSGKGLND